MENNLLQKQNINEEPSEDSVKQNGLTHDPGKDISESDSHEVNKLSVVEALNSTKDINDKEVKSPSTEPSIETTKKVNGNSESAAEVPLTLNQSTDEDCYIVSSDENSDSGADDDDDNDVMITGISDTSGELQWRNLSDPVKLFYSLMMKYRDPASILLNVFHVSPSRLPPSPETQKALLFHILSEPQPRRKLVQYNTLDDVLNLLHTCSKILVITGAGISVSCGIPDFRSRNGIYARLAVDYPDLTTPQSMFEMSYFKLNQKPFFKFAKEIYPGQFKPSISHRFIKYLESRDKLLRNYTQNIDTLEQVAGISRVINCHGSFATASCMACKHQMPGSQIREDIFAQRIPHCPVCPADTELAVMKPDIVFFGEELPETFHSTFAEDKEAADFVIVIGSSLKVRPVAYMPASVPASVPQILINREPLTSHEFDVELLGDCDTIIDELCQRLGWSDVIEEVCPMDVVEAVAAPPQKVDKEEMQTDTADDSTVEPKESIETSSSVTANGDQPHQNLPSCDPPQVATAGESIPNSVNETVSTESLGDKSTRVKVITTPAVTNNSATDMEPCTSSSLNKIIFNPGKLTEIDGELLLIEDDSSSDLQSSNLESPLPKNLADKLPANSYACFKPNTYIFSGAEYLHLSEDSDVNSVETVSSESDDMGDSSPLHGHQASYPLCVSDEEEDISVENSLPIKGRHNISSEEMECIIDDDEDDDLVSGSVLWKQRGTLPAKRSIECKEDVASSDEVVLVAEERVSVEDDEPPWKKKMKIIEKWEANLLKKYCSTTSTSVTRDDKGEDKNSTSTITPESGKSDKNAEDKDSTSTVIPESGKSDKNAESSPITDNLAISKPEMSSNIVNGSSTTCNTASTETGDPVSSS